VRCATLYPPTEKQMNTNKRQTLRHLDGIRNPGFPQITILYFYDVNEKKTKLRGRSPQANYTDRATAACRRS
jgi:hypothetical protein